MTVTAAPTVAVALSCHRIGAAVVINDNSEFMGYTPENAFISAKFR